MERLRIARIDRHPDCAALDLAGGRSSRGRWWRHPRHPTGERNDPP